MGKKAKSSSEKFENVFALPQGDTVMEGQAKTRGEKRSSKTRNEPVTGSKPPATGEVVKKQPGEVAEELGAATRKETRDGLSTMKKTTGLVSVVNGQSMQLIPLRGTRFGAAVVHEKMDAMQVADARLCLIRCVEDELKTRPDGAGLTTLEACSVNGAIELEASRIEGKYSGVFKLRVREEVFKWMVKVLVTSEQCIATPLFGLEYPYEAIGPVSDHPRGVAECIYEQSKVMVNVSKARGVEGYVRYAFFFATDEQVEEVKQRGYLAMVGDTKYLVRPVEKRTTFSQVYVYGIQSLAAAAEDFQPEFAEAAGVATDLVRFRISRPGEHAHNTGSGGLGESALRTYTCSPDGPT